MRPVTNYLIFLFIILTFSAGIGSSGFCRISDDDHQWVVWGNDIGRLHMGTVREFKRPKQRRSEPGGGMSTELLIKTQILGPFDSKEAALNALEKAVTELEERTYRNRPYLVAKIGGNEYRVGREIKFKRIPIVRFPPQYLIHITRTHTMYGPDDKDGYVMHPRPPEGRIFKTADGYGGTFTNEGDLVGGPYTTNFELCPVLKGLNQDSIALSSPYGRWVSCSDLRWQVQAVQPPPPDVDTGEESDDESDTTISTETEEEPGIDDEEAKAHALELRWLESILDAFADAEKKAADVKAQLSIQRIAAARIRSKIYQLQVILSQAGQGDEDIFASLTAYWDTIWGTPAPAEPGKAMRKVVEAKIKQLRHQLSGIYKDQDRLIADLFKTYDNISEELRLKGGRSPFPDIQKTADVLKKGAEMTRDLNYLELYLASGQRNKFKAVARQFIAEGKYVPAARLMQGLDYIEHNEPRSALEALHLCLKADPQNLQAKVLIQKLEVGYLKAIDAKTLGEAATVGRRCWERMEAHGEPGFFGALIDVFTSGVTTSISAISGDLEALGDEADTLLVDAAAQHGGLLLITRLRKKNLTLPEIRGLSNTDLITQVKKIFGQAITAQQALRMRAAMMAAFRNPDVARLEGGASLQLDVDTGKSYFDSTVFDETWGEWIGDAVNLKNVLTMVGPSTVFTKGGKLATFGYYGRWMPRASEAMDIVTLKDAFAGWIGLSKLADKMYQSERGRVCVEQLMKFEKSTGMVSHLLADALVQQGIIQASAAMGGLIGGDMGGRVAALAAEILTAYGVGDFEVAVKLLKKSGVKYEHIQVLTQQMRNRLRELEHSGIPGKYLKQMDASVQQLAEGKKIAPAQMKAITESSEEVGQRLEILSRSLKKGDISLPEVQEYQSLKALQKAFKSTQSGNLPDAKVSLDLAADMEAIRKQAIQTVELQEEACEALENGLKKAEGTVSVDAGKLRPDQQAIKNNGLQGAVAPSPTDTGFEELKGLNLRKGPFTGIPDQLILQGNNTKASRGYRDLLNYVDSLGNGKLAHIRQEIAQRLKIAERVQSAAQRFKMADETVNALAIKRIDPGELQAMAQNPNVGLEEIPGTLTQPHWVVEKVGNVKKKIGVFKPIIPDNPLESQIEETFFEFAQELGVKVPASAPATMTIKGKPVQGTFFRYVDGQELLGCDIGQQLAVKGEMARAKVLRTFLGDYDCHAKNVNVGADGHLWDIDHGKADIMGKKMITESDPFLMELEVVAEMKRNINVPQNEGQGRKIYEIIDHMERQIINEEVAATIDQIEGWSRDFLRKRLGNRFGADTQRVLDVLELRRDHLRKVFLDKYPPLSPSPIADLRWFQKRCYAGIRLPVLAEPYSYLPLAA